MQKSVKIVESKNTTQTTGNVNSKKILNNQQILSKSQKDEIKKAFDFFDITGSGTIEAKNLKIVLRELGFDPLINEEIVKLIRNLGSWDQKFDVKKIDFQEFFEIMIIKMVH